MNLYKITISRDPQSYEESYVRSVSDHEAVCKALSHHTHKDGSPKSFIRLSIELICEVSIIIDNFKEDL